MRFFPLLLSIILLGGCEDEGQRRVALADQDVDLSRITDPAHGSDELRKRILQNLKLEAPYIAIWVNDIEAQAVPVSTPWIIRCDDFSGLAVSFTVRRIEPSDVADIRLSEARPTKEQCLGLAISTAKVLQAILAGR